MQDTPFPIEILVMIEFCSHQGVSLPLPLIISNPSSYSSHVTFSPQLPLSKSSAVGSRNEEVDGSDESDDVDESVGSGEGVGDSSDVKIALGEDDISVWVSEFVGISVRERLFWGIVKIPRTTINNTAAPIIVGRNLGFFRMGTGGCLSGLFVMA